MRYFYDTEFLEDGSTIDLISIGIVSEDGREYCAVNSDMPLDRIVKHDWLVHNVLPHLPLTNRSKLDSWIAHPTIYSKPDLDLVNLDRRNTAVKPHWVIANEVREFLQPTENWRDTELWAYYGAYDHVALCQLWGKMIDLPKGIPMFTHELMQLWEQAGRPEQPEQTDAVHNALEDARWNRDLFKKSAWALTEKNGA